MTGWGAKGPGSDNPHDPVYYTATIFKATYIPIIIMVAYCLLLALLSVIGCIRTESHEMVNIYPESRIIFYDNYQAK